MKKVELVDIRNGRSHHSFGIHDARIRLETACVVDAAVQPLCICHIRDSQVSVSTIVYPVQNSIPCGSFESARKTKMTSSVKDASIEELLEVARDVVDEVANRSNVFDPSLEVSLPRFEERGEYLFGLNDMSIHNLTSPVQNCV
jgi:hypothetical protein